MKYYLFLIAIYASTVLLETEQSIANPSTNSEASVFARVNSYGSAIAALAQDRFRSHESIGEVWVVLLRKSVRADRMEKYTDGSGVIVAIIPCDPLALEGAQIYCDIYNSLVLGRAMRLAVDGKVLQAMRILELQKQFLSPDYAKSYDLERRLQAVKELSAGLSREQNETYLKSQELNYPMLPFSTIEQMTPTNVPSLFKIAPTH